MPIEILFELRDTASERLTGVPGLFTWTPPGIRAGMLSESVDEILRYGSEMTYAELTNSLAGAPLSNDHGQSVPSEEGLDGLPFRKQQWRRFPS